MGINISAIMILPNYILPNYTHNKIIRQVVVLTCTGAMPLMGANGDADWNPDMGINPPDNTLIYY